MELKQKTDLHISINQKKKKIVKKKKLDKNKIVKMKNDTKSAQKNNHNKNSFTHIFKHCSEIEIELEYNYDTSI